MSYVIRRKNTDQIVHTDRATGRRQTRTGRDSAPPAVPAASVAAALTVPELCEQMITVRQLRPATAAVTRAVCRTSIAPFFGQRPAAELTPADLHAWGHWLTGERALAASTARQHFRVLAATCQRAVHQGLLETDPCSGIRLPPVHRAPRPRPVPASRGRRRVESGSTGAAAGHSRARTPLSRLADAIQDGAHDLRPLFQPPDAD